MQIVQAIVAAAKKAGKASYVLSVDKEGGKVVHANHVPEPYRSAAFNAKTWAASISDVLGGKVSLILLILTTYTFPFVFFFCDCMYADNPPLPPLPSSSSVLVQAGGKEEGAQGVGTNVDKATEALDLAKQLFEKAVNSS